ncbi:MAG TPA: S8 family serine peptidase [Planctomycetota bacterium]|nr:S8 family serine peptidase [Planctomycetota bacterium]
MSERCSPFARLLCAAALALPAAAQLAQLDPGVPRRLAETGAPVKAWIFFRDKGPADAAALAQAQAGLSAHAVQRRALRRSAPGLVDARDLPVSAAHRAAVQAAGAVLHVESRWLDAVSATLDAGALARVAALPCVSRIQLVARSARPVLSVHPVAPPVGATDGSFYGEAETQHDMIDLPPLHTAGYAGAGIVIGVLDTGFVTTHAAFHDPGHPLAVLAAWDFVNNDGDVAIEPGDDPDQHFHGTFILGELAAYLPGTLVGAAWEASYVLCKTEDATQEVPAEEDFYVAGLEFAEQHGADVVTSSLGYIDWYQQSDLDGHTTVTAVAVNVATQNGVACCTAAGNSGYDLDPAVSHLITPGDAVDVLTVGAVEPTQEYASFTSDGPTADGRTKPEVLAMGTQVKSVWPYDDVQIAEAAGTSAATPEIAGLVACLLSAHPEWSVASLRARIIGSGSYLGSPLPDPLSIYGWGIVDGAKALAMAGTWTSTGAGLSGTQGVPQLSGTGSLVADEPASLAISQGRPGALAVLVIGLSALDAPFKGGTLVPHPDLLLGGLLLDGSGALVLNGPWSPGLPGGTSVLFQAWIPDAVATKGYAASQGLKATTP